MCGRPGFGRGAQAGGLQAAGLPPTAAASFSFRRRQDRVRCAHPCAGRPVTASGPTPASGPAKPSRGADGIPSQPRPQRPGPGDGRALRSPRPHRHGDPRRRDAPVPVAGGAFPRAVAARLPHRRPVLRAREKRAPGECPAGEREVGSRPDAGRDTRYRRLHPCSTSTTTP